MTYVDIFISTPTGKSSFKALRCSMDGTHVDARIQNVAPLEYREEAERLISSLERDGIVDYTGGRKEPLKPDTGIHFLQNLHYNFRSVYERATEVQIS